MNDFKFKVGDKVQPANASEGDARYLTVTRRYRIKGQPLYCIEMKSTGVFAIERGVVEETIKPYSHD